MITRETIMITDIKPNLRDAVSFAFAALLVRSARGLTTQDEDEPGETDDWRARLHAALAYLREHHYVRVLLIGQGAEHHPRSAAATHRHDEAPARRNRRARIRGDDRCPVAGHRLVIVLDFDPHAASSDPGFTIGIAMRKH